MSVINTNITSLIGQSNLQKSQNALQTSMERLSSGLRINSAKDDAAGQAIANRMTAQITGLNQAQRNANDGISLAQTAEGSLNQVNDNLQRIRELTVQASNSTNSSADLQSIQDEINQRLAEIDRISGETNFNGVKVLASDQSLKIQVGANDGETISVNLREINAGTLGLSQLNVSNMVFGNQLSDAITTVTEAVEPTWTEFSFTATGAGSFNLVVGNDNVLYAVQASTGGTNTYFNATFNAANNTVTIGSETTAISDSGINSQATEFDTSSGVVTMAQANDAELVTPELDPANYTVIMHNDSAGAATAFYVESAGGTFYSATLDVETGELSIDLTSGSATDPGGEEVNVNEVLTAVGSAAVSADLTAVNDQLGGTNTLHRIGDSNDFVIKNEAADGKVTYFSATVDAATGEVAVGTEPTEVVVDPLKAIDAALAQVDALRSDLGAIQNRFEDAITNLNTNATNLSAARSRIEDADYAVEVANMTRAQILQQAGTSVLAQANQIPQNVLSLLG
jgi:flagellin